MRRWSVLLLLCALACATAGVRNGAPPPAAAVDDRPELATATAGDEDEDENENENENEDADHDELGEADTSSTADAPEYRDKTVVDFDDDVTTTGTVTGPTPVITAKRRPRFRPMTRQPGAWTSTQTRARTR